MDIYVLCFKNDKDLEKLLNFGTIKGIIKAGNLDTSMIADSNVTSEQDSRLTNLVKNQEDASLGIKDSMINTQIFDEKGESPEGAKDEKKQEEKKEEVKDDGHIGIVSEKKRTLFHKIFGPMEAGSVRGSIFNMVILSLGTGMLALPKYMSNTSLLFSCVFLISICIAVWWSLLLLSKACEKTKIFNYSKLLEKLYGKKLSVIYDLIVILYSFGIIILYNIIIHQTLGEALYGLYFYDQYKTTQEFVRKSFWNEWYMKILLPYATSIVIIYPMCLIKDVSKLRTISFIGVLNILFLITIIIIQSFDFITKEKLKNDVNYINVFKGFTSKCDALNFVSTIFFAACFHIGCVPVISTLKNNVRRRIYKAIRRSVLFDISIFLTIAVIGYLSVPKDTPDLIIQREPLAENGKDTLMGIGKIGLVITFFSKLPNVYSSLRITLFDKLWGTNEITDVKNCVVTFFVIFLCVTCAIVYNQISSYIKIMGGLFSTVVGFLFPALLIARANKRKRYHWKNILTVLFFTVLTLIGFASSALTVYEMFVESK